jgi:septum site-determining protein MinC
MTMPLAPTTAVRDGSASAVDLKSVTLTMLALMLRTTSPDELAEALRSRCGDETAQLDNEPVVVDLSGVSDAEAPIDFETLVATLRQHGLQPVAVRGGSAEQMCAGAAIGLAAVAAGTPAAVTTPPVPVAPGVMRAAATSLRRGADPRVVLTEVIKEGESLGSATAAV